MLILGQLAAACGFGDVIILRFPGNGQCTSEQSINGPATFGDCTQLVYGRDCATFIGKLFVVMSNDFSLTASNYVSPDVNKGLTAMGLGSLVTVSDSIFIFVNHSPFPVPRPIAPVFLTTLRSVRHLVINECDPCTTIGTIIPSSVSVLTALPGLSGIYQLARPDHTVDKPTLEVRWSAFTDLESFAGVICTPDITITLDDNRLLTSFSGFQSNIWARWIGHKTHGAPFRPLHHSRIGGTHHAHRWLRGWRGGPQWWAAQDPCGLWRVANFVGRHVLLQWVTNPLSTGVRVPSEIYCHGPHPLHVD